MVRHAERQTDHETASTDVLITAACRVAGSDEIGAIHVVTSRRPTYAELLRFRQLASARDLELSVDASSVTVRPRKRAEIRRPRAGVVPSFPPPMSSTVARPWPVRVRESILWRVVASNALSQGVEPSLMLNRLSSALDWLSVHGQAWRTDLNAMSEGTR